jgi:hypothetical protein
MSTDISSFMDKACLPLVKFNDYVQTCCGNLLAGKTAKPEPVQANHEIIFSKVWNTAEKVGNVVLNVVEHPITKRLVKGVFNHAIDQAEIGAMEKAVDLLGDKVLPGDVAAIKIAIMLITGFTAIAKQ